MPLSRVDSLTASRYAEREEREQRSANAGPLARK